VSYRESLSGLLSIASVNPDFGKVSLLFAGVKPVVVPSDYSGSITTSDSRRVALEECAMEKIPGATWHDLYSSYVNDVANWLRRVAFSRSTYKILVLDATNPVSVLAVAALPQGKRTLVLAVSADETSTPVEQNNSYVAVSSALRRGFQVMVFPQRSIQEALIVEDDGSVFSEMAAFSESIARVLAEPDDLMDLLEGDRRFGVGLHTAYLLTSGSKRMYGSFLNAFTAQSFLLPDEIKPEDVRTFYSIVWCEKDARAEFERGFTQFRNRSHKAVIKSECMFREKENPGSFDILTIYGTGEPGVLQSSVRGYEEVAREAPSLGMGGVS
jgi:hypothetical protein